MLDLVKGKDGKYYVSRQVDLYAVQDVTNIVLPFSKQLITLMKIFFGFMCAIYAMIFQMLGFWTLSRK